MNEIIRRTTVEEIVGYRNRALELYEVAYNAIERAHEAVKAAHAMASHAHPGVNSYNYHQAEEIKAFQRAVAPPPRDQYLRVARKLVDCDVWAWIIERTDLERLMDKEAKDKLRAQMQYVPDQYDRRSGQLITSEEVEKGIPPVTVENIYATIQQFMASADMIFRRGVANAFSKLDRRFRSHDGFKIGSRIILTYAFDGMGRLAWGGIRDTLIDVERVFAVLDGKPEATFRSALGAIEQDRARTFNPRQSEVETDYFKIRGFKNGNAHLWFARDDLVEKVNKVLAEWYGEVVGDSQTQEADPLEEIKTTPAKRYGFYPTPDKPAETVTAKALLLQSKDKPPLRILEPSAGTGNLARRCITEPDVPEHDDDWCVKRTEEWNARLRFDNQVDCVEIQPELARALGAEGIYNRVYWQDFHALSPAVTGLYDRIVMNPPFDRERDIDHVMHALGFLKPDGFLIAIMSAGTEFRETKKAIAFRELVAKMGGRFDDLPAGSFSEVGTNVNTIMLRPLEGWSPHQLLLRGGHSMPQAATIPAVSDGKHMTDQPIRATSTLFSIMRTLTGMSREEARLFLGGLPEGEMRTLERPKTFFVKLQYITALSEILERVEDLIEDRLAKPAPPFLLTYAIDPDLVQFDPELHEWMRFASVHRMFTARLWNEWRIIGKPITILALVPPDYLEFLKTSGARDSEGARMRWAAGYAEHYKLHATADPTRSAPEQAALAMAQLFTFRKRGE